MNNNEQKYRLFIIVTGILTGDNNLAMGTVTVAGANNSPTIMSDWTRFSVFSVTVDMAFNHDRSDNTGSDGINIRTSGTANTEHYGPELIQNTSAGWDTLTDGAANQKTVLYLKNNTVTIYNRFVMSLVIPFTVSLDLRAATSVSIGGCTETSVTFENGVSSGNTKEILGVDGFRAFSSLSSTFNGVNKEQGTFDWNVTKIVDKSTGTGKATTTAEITFYTILDVPQDPWNPADTTALDPNDPSKTISVDDKYQPWATALEFTIQTAATKGKNSDSAALSQLTTFLHGQDDPTTTDVVEGRGMTYDTVSGSSYFLFNPGLTFSLTSYMSKNAGSTVNCFDQAAAVTILGCLLGIDVQFRKMEPFGYINQLNIVGVGLCNNPFYNNSAFSSDIIVTNGYTGSDGLPRSSFSCHSFTTLNDNVYDACAGPVTGSTLNQYLVLSLEGFVSGSTLPILQTLIITSIILRCNMKYKKYRLHVFMGLFIIYFFSTNDIFCQMSEMKKVTKTLSIHCDSDDITKRFLSLQKIGKEKHKQLCEELVNQKELVQGCLIVDIYDILGIGLLSNTFIKDWKDHILSFEDVRNIPNCTFIPPRIFVSDNSVEQRFHGTNRFGENIDMRLFYSMSTRHVQLEVFRPFLLSSAPIEVFFPINQVKGLGDKGLCNIKAVSSTQWKPDTQNRKILFFRNNVAVQIQLDRDRKTEKNDGGIIDLAIAVDKIIEKRVLKK